MTLDEIEEAWATFGASPAGRNARELLINELVSICGHADRPGALDKHEGRRTLARELLDLMDRHTGYGGTDRSGAKREPRPVNYGRSLRRVGELDDNGLTEQQRQQRRHAGR